MLAALDPQAGPDPIPPVIAAAVTAGDVSPVSDPAAIADATPAPPALADQQPHNPILKFISRMLGVTSPSPEPGQFYTGDTSTGGTTSGKIGSALSRIGNAASEAGAAYGSPSDKEFYLAQKKLGLESNASRLAAEEHASRMRNEELARQAEEQQISGYRTPEQKAALEAQHQHQITTLPDGRMYSIQEGANGSLKYYPIEAGQVPSLIAGAAGVSDTLRTSPKEEQYEVLHQGDQPYAVRDNYTKQLFYAGQDSKLYDAKGRAAPPETKMLYDNAMNVHARTRKEHLDDQASMLDRQLKMFQERLNAPSGSAKDMAFYSKALRTHLPDIEAEVNDLGARGKLGPLAGRMTEFEVGTIGADDPDYSQFRTDIGLLETGLMKAHVGARGGAQLLAHFKDLINSGKATPENIKGSLRSIDGFLKQYENFMMGFDKMSGGNKSSIPRDKNGRIDIDALLNE